MLVKRVVRPDPAVIVTDDGYRYEWAQGGEAVDVLEHHRRTVLAVKGARLVEVEVVDEPVILPVLPPVGELLLATEPPAEREPDVDLSGTDVPPVEDVPVTVDLATVPADLPPAPATVDPQVTDLWSDADIALLEQSR